MSVQFGRWNFDGKSVDPDYVAKVRAILSPYAPDATTVCFKGTFVILYGAFYTTEESRHERQPFVSPAGTFLTWDGRLDNRTELIGRNSQLSGMSATDLDVVSSLYERSGVESFGQLVGDWSLSALNHYEKTLVLAADFLGTRPLYYLHCDRYVAWSTVLEPLVVLADQRFALCEEYLAGWLYGFPAARLTPYREIKAVPPASFVKITNRAASVQKYWDFHLKEHPHYSNDSECEEGFRYFFKQAVRRRLRSSGPVVAELSGGMDSSSIVCVADRILEQEAIQGLRLDTLSFLDDTEPDWNERPFITEIETSRKRDGFHIDVSMQQSFIPLRDPEQFSSTPAVGVLLSVPQQNVATYLRAKNVRVVLSGLGGDESTGGAPSGVPELADLLARAQTTAFFQRAVAWSLAARRPFIHLVGNAVGEFLPKGLFRASVLRARVPWLDRAFERRNRTTEACAPARLRLFGPLPSVQENLYTLDHLRRQIACVALPLSPVIERRYPFLDRDLLEFIYSVPREQIVRPGRRRSLLRRALRGIVPEAVLERKRKAYVARGPLKSLHAESAILKEWTADMICSSIGVIDLEPFREALAAACRGHEAHIWRLSRTLALESWLRDSRVQSVIRLPAAGYLREVRRHSTGPQKTNVPSWAIQNRKEV